MQPPNRQAAVRCLLACAILTACQAAEPAALPLRVCVCSHSFMNFITRLLPSMAAAAGVGYASAGDQMIGASQVISHWDLPTDVAKPALRAGTVDVLIVSPNMQLPDPGIDNYAKLGCAVNPRLRVLVQASWPPFDDVGSRTVAEVQAHSQGFSNAQRDRATAESLDRLQAWQRDGWDTRLAAQVATLNGVLGHEAVQVVPVDEAVIALRKRVARGTAPGLSKQTDLFADPIGHPTQPLCALVAYCHFAAIYRRSPVGLPVPADLRNARQAAELNRLLQELAWQAVGTRR